MEYIQQAGEDMARRQSEVGTRIREARDAKGWKQKQLAAAVHVEPVTVSRWETGANSPDLATLELIAGALGRDASWFVATRRPDDQADPDESRLGSLEVAVGDLQEQVAAIAATLEMILDRLPTVVQPRGASSRRRTEP